MAKPISTESLGAPCALLPVVWGAVEMKNETRLNNTHMMNFVDHHDAGAGCQNVRCATLAAKPISRRT